MLFHIVFYYCCMFDVWYHFVHVSSGHKDLIYWFYIQWRVSGRIVCDLRSCTWWVLIYFVSHVNRSVYTYGDVWWLMFARCVLDEVRCLVVVIDVEKLRLQAYAVFDSCVNVIFANLCWQLALCIYGAISWLANVWRALSFRACVFRSQGLCLLILYAMTSKWTYCLWPEVVY